MRKVKLAFLLAAALISGGCVFSVSPLYTAKDLVYDQALEGVWARKGDTSVWKFQRNDAVSYKLTVTEGGTPSPFVAHLVQLGGHRFLDVCPELSGVDDLKQSELYKSALIPGHLIVKVLATAPTLRMQVLEDKWVEALLKKDPKALAHQEIEGDKIVFTATTGALQNFVVQHWDTPGAWSEEPSNLQKQ